MILLLGATGYLGEEFSRELTRRGLEHRSISRTQVDYTHFNTVRELLRETRPVFLVNCAGYTGKPNVDACENAKADTLRANTLLPLTIAQACDVEGVPWGHISSGCIFAGAWVIERGKRRIEKDLTSPELRQLADTNRTAIEGYTEEDEPNFTFRQPPCSFYSGSKALAEEALAEFPNAYMWRLRLPFDEIDHQRNYLSKLQRYEKVYDNVNSLSHRRDCVSACLDLWFRRAPFGKYNMTNPGFVTTRQVILWMQKVLFPDRQFKFWASDEEFYQRAASTPRSNCVLDVTKLLKAGIKIRPVEEAVIESLKLWRKAS